MRKQPPFSAAFTVRLGGGRVRLPYPRFRGAGLAAELVLPDQVASTVIQLEEAMREAGLIQPNQCVKQVAGGDFKFRVLTLGGPANDNMDTGPVGPRGGPLCPSGEEQGGPVKGLSEAALDGGTDVPCSSCDLSWRCSDKCRRAMEHRERSDRGLD